MVTDLHFLRIQEMLNVTDGRDRYFGAGGGGGGTRGVRHTGMCRSNIGHFFEKNP